MTAPTTEPGPMAPPAARPLYTLGHSNHAPEAFLALLRAHGIGCVADVRSRPYSRWPHFGRERLERLLGEAGIAYRWLGDALGGRPEDPALRDPEGAPDFAAMAARPSFRAGLETLRALLAEQAALGVPLAILCSEGDPRRCHREHLIARALRAEGVPVLHILRDGRCVDSAALGEEDAGPAGAQLTLDV